ncbi:hypothetical protein D3C75_636590 [compost metagenome]
MADIQFAEKLQEVLHAKRHGDNAGELAVVIVEPPADGDHPFLVDAATDWQADEGVAGWVVTVVDEKGSVAAVGTDGGRLVGRHQPASVPGVDHDAAHRRHQRLLALDQLIQTFDLRRPGALGFQALDQTEQQHRALPDDTFRIGGQCLGQVKAMDVDLFQGALARGHDLPQR